MKLSGSEKEELRDALLAAYPNYDDLKELVDFDLDQGLEQIAGSSSVPLKTIALNLINWAAPEKLLDLIWKAYKRKPDNEILQNITYKICGVSKAQWDCLVQILTDIDRKLIEISCYRILKKLSNDVDGNYPELEQLKKLSHKDEFTKKLKDILIERRLIISEKIPIVLEVANLIASAAEIEVNEKAKNKLKKWVTEISTQLNIKIDSKIDAERQSSQKNAIKIQPYLLILIQPQGSDEFNLEAELVIQEDNENKIIDMIPISLNKEKIVKCTKKDIHQRISQLIAVSNENYLYPYRQKKKLILELFLPMDYLISPLELLPIPTGFNETRWMGFEYKLVVRSLDRLDNSQFDFISPLIDKWDNLNEFINTKPTQEQISQKIEYISTLEEKFDWIELEVALERNKRLGLNLTCPLLISQHVRKFFITIIKTGLPLAFWLRKSYQAHIDLEREFTEILNIENFKNLDSLLEKVWQMRRDAYLKKEKAPDCLGYHLGFLRDNPNRLPSKFDRKVGAEVLVFDT